LLREPGDEQLKHLVGVLVQLLERQQLHRVGDQHHPVVRHPQRSCLLERLVDERLCRDRGRGDPEAL
jgi:hypothetical protein